MICGPSLTMFGQENSPAQPGGGASDGTMTSTQGRQGSSSPCYFSFDYKTIARVSSQGAAFLAHPPVSLTRVLFL